MRQDPIDRADPPADVPDGSGLYPASGQRDALRGLRAAIDERQHVLCLTGPAGSGKTTLLQELRRGCDRGVVALIERPTPGKLLSDLANALRVDVAEGNEALLRRRIVMLLATADQQHQPIIQLVDNAGALSTVDLNLLLHFFPRGHATLVLAGEGAPEAWLAGCETAAGPVRIDRHFRLGPWSSEEAAGYVRQRVRQARLPETLLPTAAIADMHRRSGGLPGTLERLSTEAIHGAGIPAAESGTAATPVAMPPLEPAAVTATEAQAGARPAPATLRRVEAGPAPTARRLSSEAIDRILVTPERAPDAGRSEVRIDVAGPAPPVPWRGTETPAPDGAPGSGKPPSEDRRSAEALAQARNSMHREPGPGAPGPIGMAHDAATLRQPVEPRAPVPDTRWPTASTAHTPPRGAQQAAAEATPPPLRAKPATASTLVTASSPGALPARTRRLRRSARRWRALAILSSLALAAVLTKDLWIDRIPTNNMLLEWVAAWLNEPPTDSSGTASPRPSAAPPTTAVEPPPAPTAADSEADVVAPPPPLPLREAPAASAPPDAAEGEVEQIRPTPPSEPDRSTPAGRVTDPAADRRSALGETPGQGANAATPEELPLTPAQREEVARLYADRAEYEWRRGELDAAYLSIQRGLASDPRNPRLLEMRALLGGLIQQKR